MPKPRLDREGLIALLAEQKKKKKKVEGFDLSGVDLRGLDLTRVTFSKCKLWEVNLEGVNLKEAIFNWCSSNKASFKDADMSGWAIKKGDLRGATWDGAKMVGAQLKKTELIGSLRGVDLSDSDCSNTLFLMNDLTGAILRGANLTGANFTKADLTRVDLTGAILEGTKFEDANLTDAKLPTDYESGEPATIEGLAWASTGGGPLIVIPSEIAGEWNALDGDYELACDAEAAVVVAGWVETASIEKDGRCVLVLGGEMDTTFVPAPKGGVLVRGGDLEASAGDLRMRAKKIGAKKWRDLEPDLALEQGRFFVFDAAVPGAAEPGSFKGEDGLVVGELGAGQYRVQIAGLETDEGPLVFIRLRKR